MDIIGGRVRVDEKIGSHMNIIRGRVRLDKT